MEVLVASQIPTPVRAMPATSDVPTGSPSVSDEISMPRLGVASSAIDIVLARKWRLYRIRANQIGGTVMTPILITGQLIAQSK